MEAAMTRDGILVGGSCSDHTETGQTAMIDGKPVVLVTGATGFVGRNLVPALAGSGWLVRPVRRQGSRDPNAVVIDSIGPSTDWNRALSGVDAIVHLAARVHHPGDENNAEIYRAVNTEGTLRLASEAAKAGVREFIHVSTILVNGSGTNGRAPFREDDVPNPRGIYGESKAAAEAGLKAIAGDSTMNITVVRPPLIYGHGAGGNFALLLGAVRRGIPLPLASIRNRRGFLAVENLVSFIQHRLGQSGRGFEIFLLADDKQVSTPEFIRSIAAACGRKARLFPLPISIMDWLCVVGGRPEARESVLGSMEIDTSKARATGWRPVFSLDEGLKAALRKPA
jgi:UDP-glucose 4-epimerase